MTLNPDPTWLAIFLVGLFGSTHCMGMCGGIAAALHIQTKKTIIQRLSIAFFYNTGRIISYALLGAIVGGFSLLLGEFLDIAYWSKLLRSLTGLLLIGIGLQISFRWRGLKWLESSGTKLWKRIAPIAQTFIPIHSIRDALVLGLFWGWLPCGLVYSVLATAATRGSSINGALTMVFFGLGTLPAMISTGLFSLQLQRLLQNQKLKIFSGLLIIILGAWTITAVWLPSGAHHMH